MIPAVLAAITIPVDPVIFRLGSFGIHWYGIAYVVAFTVGAQLVSRYLVPRGFSARDISDGLWWTIGFGLLGGRLYFVLQQPNLGDYLRNPLEIIAVWKGGMAFFGAVITGCLTIAVFAYRRGLPVWVTLDAGAVFATLPQAIGRIGNIINGDILGPASNLPWATRYTNPHTFAPALGVAYQPAGAYELLVALLLFALVMYLVSRRPPAGSLIIVYIAAYAVSQFLLFYLRSTEPVVAFGLKQAQLTAIGMLVLVVPGLIALRRRFPELGVQPVRDVPAPRPAAEAG
ncbi:MAG: phosphatidylglycerol---prolipoprotein diacylglyceryl transferase [Chloroflexota bacterium]|jgi:phosphatidylglycerol:prolipoprotein diacylglycerol transferase|nr:phosphatidylglycerol---prolipoprotein diacylglyceryl transferase [Chloroflexota bacterium]